MPTLYNIQSSMKGLKKYLNKYGFVSSDLADIPLASFQYLFDALFTEIEAKQSLLFNPALTRSEKVEHILQVLAEPYDSPALFLIVKRLATLFMLARKYTLKGGLESGLLEFLQKRVGKMMEEDMKELLEGKERRPGSLERAYRYIRELSGSKQKQSSKTKIELHSRLGVKGGLKETLSKAIIPFCAYLLRILQDGQAYRQALALTPLRGEALWRVINWSVQLGYILQQVSRLSHYLPKDFHSVHVFMALLCCKDLAVFYDLIKESIRVEAVQLREKQGEGKKQGISLRMLQLKKGIQELQKLKEKLNLVFGNRALQNQIPFLAKPISYKVFDEVYPPELEWVIVYGQRTTPIHKGRPREHCKTTANQRQPREQQRQCIRERDKEVQEATASRMQSRKLSLKGAQMRRGRKLRLID